MFVRVTHGPVRKRGLISVTAVGGQQPLRLRPQHGAGSSGGATLGGGVAPVLCVVRAPATGGLALYTVCLVTGFQKPLEEASTCAGWVAE